MSPAPRKPGPPPRPQGGLGEFLIRRRSGLSALAVLVAAGVAGGFLWQRFGGDVRSGEGYTLEPEAVRVEGVPPWVKADLRADALRDASLDKPLPLDDPDLETRLARAFDLHPWVRRVIEVRVESPPRALVVVDCREPVAMVRVPPGPLGEGGLLPVDGEGFVLPIGDFTREEAATYPVIAGIRSLPRGPQGSEWGDPAVGEAAAVVSLVRPEWEPLRLSECRLRERSGRREWDLVGEGAGLIRFGSAPGGEAAGEPGAAAKLAALKRIAADGPAGETLDLRDLAREAARSGRPEVIDDTESP
jgi:hypothetical protein